MHLHRNAKMINYHVTAVSNTLKCFLVKRTRCSVTNIDLLLQSIGLVDGAVKSMCNIWTFSVVIIMTSVSVITTLSSQHIHQYTLLT